MLYGVWRTPSLWQAPAVDHEQFWQLVEAARAQVGDTMQWAEAVADALVDRLVELSPEEIVAFGLRFDVLQDEAYRWDLWSAAYLINGGASDDGFEYFRGWLLAQGRQVWEAALADPDSLAGLTGIDQLDEDAEGESMLY